MGEGDREAVEWVIGGRDQNAGASHPFRPGAMRRPTFPINGKDLVSAPYPTENPPA